jgi:hypothetical protein
MFEYYSIVRLDPFIFYRNDIPCIMHNSNFMVIRMQVTGEIECKWPKYVSLIQDSHIIGILLDLFNVRVLFHVLDTCILRCTPIVGALADPPCVLSDWILLFFTGMTYHGEGSTRAGRHATPICLLFPLSLAF